MICVSIRNTYKYHARRLKRSFGKMEGGRKTQTRNHTRSTAFSKNSQLFSPPTPCASSRQRSGRNVHNIPQPCRPQTINPLFRYRNPGSYVRNSCIHKHPIGPQRNTLSHKHDFANADRTYVTFGAGRYAHPRRSFASMPLKRLLAHLLQHFNL